MIHIYILVESPFTKRDFERFGIEILRSNFSVKVFDFSNYIDSEFNKHHEVDRYVVPELKTFSNTDSLSLEIENSKNNDNVVIDYLSTDPRAFIIRKHFKIINSRFVTIQNGLIPISPTESSLLPQLKSKKFSFREIKKLILKNFYKSFKNSKHESDIIVVSGKEGDRRVDNSIQKIYSHSFDYDIYIQNKKKITVLDPGPYSVFLDEDMIFHSDYLHDGFKPPMKSKKYYSTLNIFFDWIESNLGVKVIWALHPRSKFEPNDEIFKGRFVYKFKTFDLVANSKFVLLHSSTSISFPILFEKPLVFMTMKDLNASWIGPRINFRASCFGKKPLFIDNVKDYESNFSENLDINHELYKSYKDNYIKYPGTKDKLSWEIFSEEIQKIKSEIISNFTT